MSQMLLFQSSFKLQLGLWSVFSRVSNHARVSLTPSGEGYTEQGSGLCFHEYGTHSLSEQNINPSVWADGKLGLVQNAVPFAIKLKDPHLFSHQKQYPLKTMVKEWAKSSCTDFLWCKWDFKLQSSEQQCSIFKATETQGGVESSRNIIPLTLLLETPILRKVEKANDIFKRHLCKLTQDTQDSWLKVLPIPLMRALTAHQNGIISMTDRFCAQILS